MRSFRQIWWMVPVAVLVTACGGRDSTPEMDDSLRRDLAMAASAQPMMPQQFMSPTEMYGQNPYGQYPQAMPYNAYQQPYYVQQAPQPQPVRVVYRNAPTATRSTGTVARSTPPSGTIIQRNTVRDAAIGAGVGAVAGAAIKKNTQGALVGAAIGGVLGGVIGHTVDVKRQP